jgi:hypothetical protein
MIWHTALQTRVATRSQASTWRSLPSVQGSAIDLKTAEKPMVREAMPVSGRIKPEDPLARGSRAATSSQQ